MPELLASAFFPSRPLQRLEKKATCTILDLDEASGAPRLTTCDLFGSASRNGLFVGNNPVNLSDPTGEDPVALPGGGFSYVARQGFDHTTGGLPDFLIGTDGNAGAGVYAFNQGHLGTNLYGSVLGGTVFGGPGNRTGVSYHGSPVLAILSVGQSTQSSEDVDVSLAWIAPSVSLETLTKVATTALDAAAGWAVEHRKEVAGVINSNGESVVGPKSGRQELTSDPGSLTNAIAVWHLHLFIGNDPYKFSYSTANNPRPGDQGFMQAHPNLYYFLGVLNAPPGQFTIIGQVPHGLPYTVRPGPQPWPYPGG